MRQASPVDTHAGQNGAGQTKVGIATESGQATWGTTPPSLFRCDAGYSGSVEQGRGRLGLDSGPRTHSNLTG